MPRGLRNLRGRRVAVVNDVINAGSAVRGTLADLQECAAEVAAVGALLTLGPAARDLADAAGAPLAALETAASNLWVPNACPLCAVGAPLVQFPEGHASGSS